MKKIYTAWNINLLAEEMTRKILQEWKEPFFPPVVIFSDIKTEQWFHLFWMKNPLTKNSVLMNLKSTRLQSFLFKSLMPTKEQLEKIGITSVKPLSVEFLRDVIISKLLEENEDGSLWFENLHSPDVSAYIFQKGKINEICLYDFSKDLASLFMDYEDTRPSSLSSLLEKSLWQKKLYEEIFHCTVDDIDALSVNAPLVSLSEKSSPCITKGSVAYLSLFQLFLLNKKLNEGKLVFNERDLIQNLFVFGFSGMGEIYRNILLEFSKERNLHVFLQTSSNIKLSCKIADEKGEIGSEKSKVENENALVQKWGAFGAEHLFLMSKDSCVEEVFEKKENSLPSFTNLKQLQYSVQQNKKNSPRPFSKKIDDGSITLTACPSTLREIENLHTKVCQIIQRENAKFSDFLVVAPNIQDYKVSIEQIFSQNSSDISSNLSISDFPNIPYIIADYSTETCLTTQALRVFHEIGQKGFFSRSDLFSLCRNNLVQTVRNLNDDEISSWAEWADELNVYRDRENDEKIVLDWQKAKNRILLSRLTKNLVVTEEKEYLPFETISSQNNSYLNDFISAVDELEKWVKLSCKEKFSLEDINEILNFLSRWLLLSFDIPSTLFGENYIFQNITEEIERQKITFNNYVYFECFFSALFDKAKGISLHSSSILASALTFANFAPNRILSAKYVFFLGLDSKDFPGMDSENVLDLRTSHYNSQKMLGDEVLSAKNKNAFLCQLMAAEKGFFISYVNKNLQKDEDFYPSSVVNELFLELYEKTDDDKIEYEEKISIDENRNWSELFTKREFRNKKIFLQLQSAFSNLFKDKEFEQAILRDSVFLYQMKKYLNDPFVFYAEEIFCKDEDSDQIELCEFEPLSFSSLQKSEIEKKLIKKLCLCQGNFSDAEESLVQECKHELKNENLLPDSFFGDEALEFSFTEAKIISEEVKKIIPQDEKMVFDREVKLNLQNAELGKLWEFRGKTVLHNADFEDCKKLVLVDFNKSENFINSYLSSLSLLASMNDDSEMEVSLYVLKTSDKKKNPVDIKIRNFRLKKNEAVEILNAIYKAMFFEKFYKCMPYDIFKKDKDIQSISSLKKLEDKLLAEHGSWAYFSKRCLFTVESDVGYSTENFKSEWQLAFEHQEKLMGFLREENSRGDEND